jgi:hypothetical protein
MLKDTNILNLTTINGNHIGGCFPEHCPTNSSAGTVSATIPKLFPIKVNPGQGNTITAFKDIFP